jgi:Redoxin
VKRAFGPLHRPGRGGMLLAVFVVAVLGWITLNTVRSDSPGSRGLPPGVALPAFAVPLSGSSCRGPCDANIATRSGEGAAGSRPACRVRGPHVLTSCRLAADAPAVLAFVFAPVPACRGELDVLARARARHPGVRFAAVVVRADGARARTLAQQHPGVPLAYDHDGAVANEYAVVICPTITFIDRDGRVDGSHVGPLDAADLERWLARIE